MEDFQLVNEVPVAISVQADQDVFRFYKSGILDSDDCGTNVNHGALAVGYDVLDGKGFWIVKNSWGESWGEQGYIRIARASDAGICGVNTNNVFASVYLNSMYRFLTQIASESTKRKDLEIDLQVG